MTTYVSKMNYTIYDATDTCIINTQSISIPGREFCSLRQPFYIYLIYRLSKVSPLHQTATKHGITADECILITNHALQRAAYLVLIIISNALSFSQLWILRQFLSALLLQCEDALITVYRTCVKRCHKSKRKWILSAAVTSQGSYHKVIKIDGSTIIIIHFYQKGSHINIGYIVILFAMPSDPAQFLQPMNIMKFIVTTVSMDPVKNMFQMFALW